MDKHENHSEVARLMQQINEANEAAYQALYGLAQDTAQHAFITAKMERIRECHVALKVLVVEHQANMLLVETLEQAGTREPDQPLQEIVRHYPVYTHLGIS